MEKLQERMQEWWAKLAVLRVWSTGSLVKPTQHPSSQLFSISKISFGFRSISTSCLSRYFKFVLLTYNIDDLLLLSWKIIYFINLLRIGTFEFSIRNYIAGLQFGDVVVKKPFSSTNFSFSRTATGNSGNFPLLIFRSPPHYLYPTGFLFFWHFL